MPGEDLKIGNDGDYIDDGNGAFELTTTAQPSLRHQILDRLGEWLGDPDAGREIRGVRGRNSSEAELEAERDSFIRALQRLEAEDIIADIEVDFERDQRGRFVFFIRTRDTQSGGLLEFSQLEEFGE